MNKKYIISNWKNYIANLAQAQEILNFVDEYLESAGKKSEQTLVFCPPSNILEQVGKILKESHLEDISFLGAQDYSEDLKNTGAQYVIVGHSDRRYKMGESDEVTNQKLKNVLKGKMIPIVCIGEKVRDENFKDFLKDQISATFLGLTKDDLEKCIIAYEPVWAISSNLGAKADSPESALESIKIIRNTLIGNWKLEIENLPKTLYGGSVNSQNIAEFLNYREEDFDSLDGVLIGRASTQKEEFVKILQNIQY